MFKTFACTLTLFLVGCSDANFDIAELPAECADCSDSTPLPNGDSSSLPDSLDDDSSEGNKDSLSIEDSSSPDVQPTDSLVADSYVPDTHVSDTYTSPKDTGPSCTPKTCTSIYLATGNQACGTQSDGCGGYVSCGTCTDITKACGGSPGFDHIWSPSTGSLGSPLPPVPYQCVGVCESQGSIPSFCSNSYGWTTFIRCSNPILTPLKKCVGSSYAAFAGDKSAWCCETGVIQ